MPKKVEITVPDNQEVQMVILRPLAAELATAANRLTTAVAGAGGVHTMGTSTATASATYSNGNVDSTADVSIDL